MMGLKVISYVILIDVWFKGFKIFIFVGGLIAKLIGRFRLLLGSSKCALFSWGFIDCSCINISPLISISISGFLNNSYFIFFSN